MGRKSKVPYQVKLDTVLKCKKAPKRGAPRLVGELNFMQASRRMIETQ